MCQRVWWVAVAKHFWKAELFPVVGHGIEGQYFDEMRDNAFVTDVGEFREHLFVLVDALDEKTLGQGLEPFDRRVFLRLVTHCILVIVVLFVINSGVSNRLATDSLSHSVSRSSISAGV